MNESLLVTPSPIWHLNDALELVRVLQPETLKVGFNVNLDGSLVHTGAAKKYLNLTFLPLNGKGGKFVPKLLEVLSGLWGKGTVKSELLAPGSVYHSRIHYNYGGKQHIAAFIVAVAMEGEEPAVREVDYEGAMFDEVAPFVSPESGQLGSWGLIPVEGSQLRHITADYWRTLGVTQTMTPTTAPPPQPRRIGDINRYAEMRLAVEQFREQVSETRRPETSNASIGRADNEPYGF